MVDNYQSSDVSYPMCHRVRVIEEKGVHVSIKTHNRVQGVTEVARSCQKLI